MINLFPNYKGLDQQTCLPQPVDIFLDFCPSVMNFVKAKVTCNVCKLRRIQALLYLYNHIILVSQEEGYTKIQNRSIPDMIYIF